MGCPPRPRVPSSLRGLVPPPQETSLPVLEGCFPPEPATAPPARGARLGCPDAQGSWGGTGGTGGTEVRCAVPAPQHGWLTGKAGAGVAGGQGWGRQVFLLGQPRLLPVPCSVPCFHLPTAPLQEPSPAHALQSRAVQGTRRPTAGQAALGRPAPSRLPVFCCWPPRTRPCCCAPLLRPQDQPDAAWPPTLSGLPWEPGSRPALGLAPPCPRGPPAQPRAQQRCQHPPQHHACRALDVPVGEHSQLVHGWREPAGPRAGGPVP